MTWVRRKRFWSLALLTALVALIVVTPGRIKAPIPETSSPTPVLMLHGMFGTGAVWSTMEPLLQGKGLTTRSISISPVDGSATLAELAQQLDRHVETFRTETGAATIDLIGHSMGALVIRYWLQRMDGNRRTRRFISLAGPHHGVVGGYLSHGAGAEQMRPNSSFLVDLERDDDPFGDVEAFSFYSPFDLIIVPATSAILPGAVVNRAFRVSSHHRMVESEKIRQAVLLALLEGPRAFSSLGLTPPPGDEATDDERP